MLNKHTGKEKEKTKQVLCVRSHGREEAKRRQTNSTIVIVIIED